MIRKPYDLIQMNEAWFADYTGALETLQTQFGKHLLSAYAVPDTMCSTVGTNQQSLWSRTS